MDISSSNYFSVSASTNKGMSGLISGMDTESMVEQMLSGTQGKIDAQQQLYTQTEWKQEIYRDVIDTVKGFREKYFDTSFDSSITTNFAKSSLFDSMTSSVASGNAVKIISTGEAQTGETRITVKSLATAAKLSGTSKLSGDAVINGSSLDVTKVRSDFSKTVTLRISNSVVQVDLNGVTTEDGMIEAFNDAFRRNGVTGASAKMHDGEMRFVFEHGSPKAEVLTNMSTSLGLQMTGLSTLNEASVTDESGSATGVMYRGGLADVDAGVSFDITLDGVTKTITVSDFSENGAVTTQSVADALSREVQSSFGGYIKVELEDGALKMSMNSSDPDGHEIKITGTDASKYGFTPGDSTLISLGGQLKDLGLSGDRFSFTINGVDFEFDGNDTLSSVINKVNASKAGVKLSYSSLSDKFTLSATETGERYGIELVQSEGNLLGKLFGEETVGKAQKVVSGQLTVGSIKGRPLASDFSSDEMSFKITVNGKTSTFSLGKQTGHTYTSSEAIKKLNEWLGSNYGNDSTGKANIRFENGELKTADGFVVSFERNAVDSENGAAIAAAMKSDLAFALGLNTSSKSNAAGAGTLISDVLQLKGIAGSVLDADGSPAETLGDIASINGVAVAYAGDGRLVLTGAEGGGEIDLTGTELAKIFGADKIATSDGKPAAGAIAAGSDASVIINGVETTRNSNTFSVDGLTLQLTRVSAMIGSEYEETVVETTRDTEKIVDAFKGFIEDYNKMVTKLRDLVDADPSYKEYAPLTAEQKKEMSEREIELWEEKAKEGLVRRDSAIESMLSALRSSLYTKPEGSAYALYDIGIETTSYFATNGDKGVLIFDETAFRNALAADPNSIKTLWTDPENGLAVKFMDALDSAVRSTGGTKGTLVQLAGIKGSSTEKSNTLYTQLVQIKERISDLQSKYERERQRYWNLFNSMETTLSNYNAQSNMLSSYFSA